MIDLLMVIETDNNAYLGVPDIQNDWVIVRTGLRGRPVVLHEYDIVSCTPAVGHPDVVMA